MSWLFLAHASPIRQLRQALRVQEFTTKYDIKLLQGICMLQLFEYRNLQYGCFKEKNRLPVRGVYWLRKHVRTIHNILIKIIAILSDLQ